MLSNKIQSVLALIAIIVLAAVVVVQVLELSFYSATPSIWPM